ncbi:unnamed protein product [Ceutorhynchus assimilis]|uniref:Uncharacterized protein n=1 Tax=Ceutorhynchus assimilis TaxID=467358 RepID=A0A9N9MTP9_9CUCU|nr:unnamed protein product [Ceutorhynchus assimilis]
MRSTAFGKDGKLDISNYMDEFPFSFHLLLRNITSLWSFERLNVEIMVNGTPKREEMNRTMRNRIEQVMRNSNTETEMVPTIIEKKKNMKIIKCHE